MRQQGFGLIKAMLLVAIIGSSSILLMKLAPMYYHQIQVSSAMNDLHVLSKSGDLAGSEAEARIKKKLRRQFAVDNINIINHENIKVTPKVKTLLVKIAYEERVNLFANIDLILTFDKSINLSRHGE